MALPEWWAEQAANNLDAGTNAGLRSELWIQMARANLKRGDQKAALLCAKHARESVLAAWGALVCPPPSSRPTYASSKREVNYRDAQALVPPLNAILEDLFAIEKIQHEAGDDLAAQDTLLMRLKSVEVYPRNNFMSDGERPQSPNVWLALIAGRMQLRQHNEPADIILESRDWASDSRRLRGFDDAILADTAAGAEDVATCHAFRRLSQPEAY